MKKLEEAQTILRDLGLPTPQHNEMAGLTLLALCGMKEHDEWKNAKRFSLGVTKGIMAFISENYNREYAPNTRETVRRLVLHQFVQAQLADYNPDIPDLPVNSPRAHYAISQIALQTIQKFNTKSWKKAVSNFKNKVGDLSNIYRSNREHVQVPVILNNGNILQLSPGKHNEVQAAVIELFAPRFAPGTTLLYLGDTENKNLFLDSETLAQIGIPIDKHSKLPDIVIYDISKNWIYLVEVVTSHGPMTPKRIIELNALLKNCGAGKIYITAFPSFAEFKKHTKDIAWETEVWIMEIPDHMIHFNGDKFFGPRK